MAASLRPGGVMPVEEPDFVTIYEAAEPAALRRVTLAAMRELEATCPIDCEYGRRLFGDLDTVGLVDLGAEGRCPVVRGGTPPAADFLGLTLEKLRDVLIENRRVREHEFAEALAALRAPGATIVMPMTVAAWGRRPS